MELHVSLGMLSL